MGVPLLDSSSTLQPIRGRVLQTIEQIVDSGVFIMGPHVERFERRAAEKFGCKYGVGMSSGTDALLAALMALKIGPGDEVIVPPFTFFATAAEVWRVGARPVFVDIDPATYNMDPNALDAAITNATKAVMPVHLYGQCADMTAIQKIADRRGVTVIEDAAQAHGATHHGRPAGSMGLIGCFSFYPTKNLAAFGDAGLCTAQDETTYQQLRTVRQHGGGREYYHDMVGGNFRLDAIQAAILDIKLDHLDEYTAKRRALASRYDELLAGLDLALPVETEGNVHVYHQYTIRCERRDDLCKHLAERNIAHKVYYPLPLHLQPCFAELGYQKGQLPHSERASEQVVSLPIYPGLNEAQQEEVASAIRSFFGS